MRNLSDLEPLVPMVAFDGAGHGLTAANGLAVALLGAELQALTASGFASGLFGDDAAVLAGLLADAGEHPSAPVTVRWGRILPVRFIEARARRRPDGSVVVALVDRSDQYRLDSFLTAQGGGLFLQDEHGYVQWQSLLTQKLMGLPPENILGVIATKHLHPDDQERMADLNARAVANPGTPHVGNFRYDHPLMPQTWFQMRVTCIYLPDEQAIGGMARHVQFALDSNDDHDDPDEDGVRLTLSEIMPSGLIIATGDRINVSNNLARRMLGSALIDDEPGRWLEALRIDDRDAVRDMLHRAQADGQRGTVLACIDGADDQPVWVRIEAMPATNDDGDAVGYAATLLDVTPEIEARGELEVAHEKMWVLANHDTLTGLPNRMQFNDCLDQALARRRRDGQSVGLLFCDVDRFKLINDRYGHRAGDSVIVEVANRLTNGLRESDRVFRLGGDEFVVICEGVAECSEHLAKRLIDNVSALVQVSNTTDAVGLSVGIAYARDGDDAADLLMRADGALYLAKEGGRGRYMSAA